jgi:hypothetical protein
MSTDGRVEHATWSCLCDVCRAAHEKHGALKVRLVSERVAALRAEIPSVFPSPVSIGPFASERSSAEAIGRKLGELVFREFSG